jgi:hypothetical protein
MVRQDLLTWIRSAEDKGYSSEQLYSYLVDKGFPVSDVREALNASKPLPVTLPAPTAQPVADSHINESYAKPAIPPEQTGMRKLFTTKNIVIAAAVLVLIAVLYVLFFTSVLTMEPARDPTTLTNEEVATQTLTTITTPCDTFNENLLACQQFTCQFTHPFTGEIMERSILGRDASNCFYREQLPNGGIMSCEYSDEYVSAVVAFNQDTDFGSRASTEIYMINGKSVRSPIQEALNTGTCTVNGFRS